MPKRCMAYVVTHGDGFNQVFIQTYKSADGSCNFGDQLHMKHPVSDMIILNQIKNLSFVDIPCISQRVENPVPINRKRLTEIGVFMQI